jgi:hypothetical protein
VVLVELVLLLGEEASALVGEGDCCRVMQWRSPSWCFEEEASALVGEGDRCWVKQWRSSSWSFSAGRKYRRWWAKVTAAG